MKLTSLIFALTGVNCGGCGILVGSARECRDVCNTVSGCHAWTYRYFRENYKNRTNVGLRLRGPIFGRKVEWLRIWTYISTKMPTRFYFPTKSGPKINVILARGLADVGWKIDLGGGANRTTILYLVPSSVTKTFLRIISSYMAADLAAFAAKG